MEKIVGSTGSHFFGVETSTAKKSPSGSGIVMVSENRKMGRWTKEPMKVC